MIRQVMEEKGVGFEKEFRWRGGAVSRVEGFSDAVFAFAVTLLVVSLEVPRTFDDLMRTMKGFVAFGLCFTLLAWIWYNHYIFFRRYGLQNTLTITLNSILLFVILFYIYPLKFLFTLLINMWFGYESVTGVLANASEMNMLMIIYSIGFLSIFSVYFFLYLHAYGKREELELDPVETLYTKAGCFSHTINMAIAVLSILIVVFGGSKWAAVAGIVYGLIGPAQGVFWKITTKKIGTLTGSLEVP